MGVINTILGLGASVIMPIVIFLLGVVFRMKVKNALRAGLTVGIGFTGISLAISLVSDNLGGLVKAMQANWGLALDITDVGWPAASGIAFGSGTFVLVTCGLGSSLLALLVWIIDIKGCKKWSRFFESFGVNPLFIYVMAGVIAVLVGAITVTYQGESVPIQQVVYRCALQPVFGDEGGSLAYAILFVLLNWSIGYILYKKKIYIKI